MLVAITGGTGFIGRKLLLRLLDSGVEIRLLSRQGSSLMKDFPRVELCTCDLVSSGASELASALDGVDVLYHCAGQVSNPQNMRALHVDGTVKLVEAASGRIKHWVQLSSVGVYGQIHKGAVTEDSPQNPVGEYETTKAESDAIVHNAAPKGDFSFTILRPSNVFGDEMVNQSLFSMIRMIERGGFCYIGKRGASANYIHVDNVVEGLIRCGSLSQKKNRIYNLSDYCALEDFVEVLASSLGCKTPQIRIPGIIATAIGKTFGCLPGFPLTLLRVQALSNRSTYSIDRIQKELGYDHVISMKDGLENLVRIYKDRR